MAESAKKIRDLTLMPDITTHGGLMRTYILGTAAIAAAVIVVACSGGASLSPAPNTDLNGGGASHRDDTTVVSGPTKPPQVPPVVSSFALSGTINGHEPGADTMKVVPVPNAGLTLVKVAGVNGDTLSPSVTVASTTTDAQGAYRLENLAPAYYRIDITAPAGSPYVNATSGIGPARESEVMLSVSLARKP
jgi:hypothetical protein